MKKALGVALLTTFALGCGSAGGGTGATTGGLRGKVVRGPTMPVCRVGVPCEAPARGVKLLFLRSGKVAASATTNQKGFYRVAIKPGTYSVRTNRRAFESVPRPSRVSVTSSSFKRVDFHIDTGIR